MIGARRLGLILSATKRRGHYGISLWQESSTGCSGSSPATSGRSGAAGTSASACTGPDSAGYARAPTEEEVFLRKSLDQLNAEKPWAMHSSTMTRRRFGRRAAPRCRRTRTS